MLNVQHLCTRYEGKYLLEDISFCLDFGQVLYLLGGNGAGKSSLALSLAGDPKLQVTGSVQYQATPSTPAVNLLELKPETRAQAGVYLAFQYPPELPGVSIAQFLHFAHSASLQPTLPFGAFLEDILLPATKLLNLSWEFVGRFMHQGLSGGEQKRLLLLEMLVLKPKLLILDELDSGLDSAGLKLMVKTYHWLRSDNPDLSLVVITHQKSLLKLIPPHQKLQLLDGEIVVP